MAFLVERPGEQLRLPLQPATAQCGHDQGTLYLLGSVQCRERGVSKVARRLRPQDLESADSKKVVMCAVFAPPLPLDFPFLRPRRSSEDAVIPSFPHA